MTKRTGMLASLRAFTASTDPLIALGPVVELSTRTPLKKHEFRKRKSEILIHDLIPEMSRRTPLIVFPFKFIL